MNLYTSGILMQIFITVDIWNSCGNVLKTTTKKTGIQTFKIQYIFWKPIFEALFKYTLTKLWNINIYINFVFNKSRKQLKYIAHLEVCFNEN